MRKVVKVSFLIFGAFIAYFVFAMSSLKSFFNPVTRPISFETQSWGKFVKLTPRTIKVGKAKGDVHKRFMKYGFKPTALPYHQFQMCRALAENKSSLFSGSEFYLDECKRAKMDIIRRYANRSEYSDENGKHIYEVIFPDVYEKESSEFPCSIRYAVYPIYDNEMKLVDAFGTKNESGCL